MKITAIKHELNKSGRYALFVDDAYACSLGGNELLDSGLVVGQLLQAQELEDLLQRSATDAMYAQTLNYVTLRRRTVHEVEVYLNKKKAPSLSVEQITNKLLQAGFLSDEAYARAYIRDRQTLRPASRRKIMMELRKKNVDEQTIKAALDGEDLSEEDSLSHIIQTKQRQARYQDPIKLTNYLIRQGFRYEDIKKALQK